MIYQNEDVIIAKKDGKYGIIDLEKSEITGFLYSSITSSGLIASNPTSYYKYVLDGKVGAIDVKGKDIVPSFYNTDSSGEDVVILIYHDLVAVLSLKEKEFTVTDQNQKQLLYFSGIDVPRNMEIKDQYLCLSFFDRKEYYTQKGERVLTIKTMVGE